MVTYHGLVLRRVEERQWQLQTWATMQHEKRVEKKISAEARRGAGSDAVESVDLPL